jgi:hypothetical protein
VVARWQSRMGQSDAARDAFPTAQTILTKHMPDPRAGRPIGESFPYRPGDYHDWLHARIVVGEASALLDMDDKPGQRSSKVSNERAVEPPLKWGSSPARGKGVWPPPSRPEAAASLPSPLRGRRWSR